jgi:hypothetical protein
VIIAVFASVVRTTDEIEKRFELSDAVNVVLPNWGCEEGRARVYPPFSSRVRKRAKIASV